MAELVNHSASKGTVNSRFTSQTSATQDIQPVGLLQSGDFRKKQAEAVEQNERFSSGAATPIERALTPNPTLSDKTQKKKRKQATKGKLSFGDDDDEPQEDKIAVKKPKSAPGNVDEEGDAPISRKRLGANSSIAAPKVMTKSAQLKEAETKERLKKEFLVIQEAVKATEFEIPFVFFDGTNNPGGRCRIKKGEHVWLFLDRSRKIGAELGVSGGERAGTRREWARVSVDDLMLVRGEVIIPHHYDFYYFIINKSKGYDGKVLFPYSSEITRPSKSDNDIDLSTYDPLTAYKNAKIAAQDIVLEGADEDSTFTKVVDRRWYERNKHIYPASAWEEFDPTKDYSKTIRRDPGGNAYFFS